MTNEQLVEARNQLPKKQGGGFYYHDMSIPAAMAIEYHKQDADIRALDVEIEKRGLRYEWRKGGRGTYVRPMTELEREEAWCDFFRNRIRKSDLRRKVELAAISANNNKGVKPMVEHYETLEVNGKQYEVFVIYEGNDPKDDPGKYFDVFDSDGCCINPDVTFLKPPIEQDIAAAIRRLNGSDEAYDYQRTEDAMDALSESMNPVGGE
jgi:hypothetical protein